MGCICNCFLWIINCILMTFSFCILVSGIYLQIGGKSDCEKVLAMPLLVLGALLVAISIIGVMGSSCPACMYIYLTIMFFLIIGVFGFTIFVFIITNQTVGDMFSSGGKIEKPKNALDLSNWLALKVNKEENWNKIKSCLVHTKVCTTNEYKVDVNFNFNIMVFFNEHFPDLKLYNKSLPELQAACCVPPNDCGFKKINETSYEKTKTKSKDEDCNKWANDLSTQCFECNTCKSGVVKNIKREWKALAYLNICLMTFLLLIYMIGCCAFCF